MSEDIKPVSSSEGAQEAATPQASSGGDEGYTAATTISTLQDLQQKAPKLYKAMIEGLASQMISQMRQQNEELKKLRQDYERNQ